MTCKQCGLEKKFSYRETHLTVKHKGEVMKAMEMLGQVNLHLGKLQGTVQSGYAALEGKDKTRALRSLKKVMSFRRKAHTELVEYYQFLKGLKR